MVVFGLISVHYSTKNKVTDAAIDLVNKAEDTYNDTVNAGGKRFEDVVNTIYSWIPVKFDPFISKDLVRKAVQKAFDLMKSFANKQLDKLDNKIVPETTPDAPKEDATEVK
jgi:hypothetical protein